ncbi:MAG: glutamine-hydrolyzing carbamoyl-phosphate synthase small subunit, partial [Candidatus Bathyarchaeia archaeon]
MPYKNLKCNILTEVAKGSLIKETHGFKEASKLATLILADGIVVHGIGFGAQKKVYGEVVFNTGMVGYPEAITDPSYNGQILVQTYPLIGNYGVCEEHFESDGPKIEGYVIHELCREPSHWASKRTLDEWLEASGVPGIERVDTRMLTKKIRVHGVILGILCVYEHGDDPDIPALLEEVKHIPDPNKTDLVAEVATKKIQQLDVNGKHHVVLIDCGVKKSIVRSLLNRKVNVTIVPPYMSAEKILDMSPDGILLSNGPGDPKMVPYLIKTVKQLIETNIPIMGICLGNQILALAFGGDTYKLKFGHRGQNHPCIELNTGRCYITSQNHGYAVNAEQLKGTGLRVTHINANDKTVEGLAHEKK